MSSIKKVLICGLGAIGAIYAVKIAPKTDIELKVLVDSSRFERYKSSPLVFNGVSYNFDYVLPSRTDFVADLIIIGDGRSGKHIESTMETLKINLKKEYEIEGIMNGTANDGWVILDLGNIIIHLFIPPVREIYKLEELFYTKK